MDIARQEREDLKLSSPNIICDRQIKSDILTPPQTQPKVKRSFDVAFLMMPDEKLKNRQAEKIMRFNDNENQTTTTTISVRSNESLREISDKRFAHTKNNLFVSEPSIHSINNNNIDVGKNERFYVTNSPSIRLIEHNLRVNDVPKSAFTKVPHSRQESPVPPPSSLSPGQMSCSSSSPPICSSPPRSIIYQPNNFRPEYQFMGGSPFHTISQMQQIAQSQHKFKQQFAYRPAPNQPNDMASAAAASYLGPGHFPFGSPNPHPFTAQPELSGIVRNPAAAALLTTLIPPTIATTFSLTAQNVCAKCNISFRMTSDLVYHMRSHHKSDVANETNRRKREDKLKCPVCNESFRERHHLTRHMTAHQDKASDDTDTDANHRRQK